jgi:phosphorylcholine metabolism protein LicD
MRKTFEDIEVNVPIGYEEYLDNLYGKDWMELPDESKRQSHHNVKAYWV